MSKDGRRIKALIVIRVLFCVLIAGAAALAGILFILASVFASTSPDCRQGWCTLIVLLMTATVSLPTLVMLLVGWWRAEITVKRIAAGEDAGLKGFRLAMLAAILATGLLALAAPDDPYAMLRFLFAATALVWLIVEIAHAAMKR